MGSPTQAAAQQAATNAPPAPAAPAGDSQNAALLATLAKSGAPLNTTSNTNGQLQQAQNNQAMSALRSSLQNVAGGTPQAFAQQQAQQTAAPFDLAASLARQQSGANGAALGAVNSANGNYMGQIQAAYPIVNALAQAQVARANNEYATQQLQQHLQLAQLQQQQAMQPGQLQNQYLQNQLQSQQLQAQIAHPQLYQTQQQQQASQAGLATQALQDPSLAKGTKDEIFSITGNPQAFDMPSALRLLSGIPDNALGKEGADRNAIQKYIQSYYTNGSYPAQATPQESTAAAPQQAAPQQAAPQKQSFWDSLFGTSSPRNPSALPGANQRRS